MKIEVSKEWCMAAAQREGAQEVGAGAPALIKDPKESDTEVWRDPRYSWKGEGAEPAKWFAEDGTLVYRSYADYCDD